MMKVTICSAEAYNSTNGPINLETTHRRKVPSQWLADSSSDWP